MRIGLIDVDGGKFPNYALMKISQYHKSIGDIVEWANPIYGNYDKIYKSKIFTFTPDDNTPYNCEIIKGGTGYDIHSALPDYIDNCSPDYSIYPYIDNKTAYGFITRGCENANTLDELSNRIEDVIDRALTIIENEEWEK